MRRTLRGCRARAFPAPYSLAEGNHDGWEENGLQGRAGEGLGKGWGRAGEGLVKGWGRAGEGLVKGW